MKANEATVFIFIASIIIGVLISANINFSSVNNKIFLTPAEYQEAYDYTNKLNKDIDNLAKKYLEVNGKLLKYNESKNNKDKIIADVTKEIEDNKLVIGEIDVEGEGIVINLSDASDELQGDIVGINDYWSRTVHDSDIVNVVNELKMAGAEVISVNGHRLTDRSSILCVGVFIEVDGVKIPGPFNIQAIGNKDKLYSYMVGEGGYISYLKIRGIKINMNKYDNIKILANDRINDIKYMRMMEIKDKK